MEIILTDNPVCVVIILEKNEVGRMLPYVDVALIEKDIEEGPLDFLYENLANKKRCLIFNLAHKELLIRILQLIMIEHGAKLRFTEEEEIYSVIVRLQADFRQKQPR